MKTVLIFVGALSAWALYEWVQEKRSPEPPLPFWRSYGTYPLSTGRGILA